jgi:hypothetical protein
MNNGYGDTGIRNEACASRRGQVHRQTCAQVALQLVNSGVRLCSHTCRYIIKPMKNKRIRILSVGFVMATRLLALRNIGDHFHDEEFQIDVCQCH